MMPFSGAYPEGGPVAYSMYSSALTAYKNVEATVMKTFIACVAVVYTKLYLRCYTFLNKALVIRMTS